MSTDSTQHRSLAQRLYALRPNPTVLLFIATIAAILIAKKFGASIADNCTILYGGSCNASNAKELFAQPDVDGGLIGGASLSVEKFLPIIEAFN